MAVLMNGRATRSYRSKPQNKEERDEKEKNMVLAGVESGRYFFVSGLKSRRVSDSLAESQNDLPGMYRTWLKLKGK